jgi:Concanavalin A-like lectin/glucanases superfamily
VRGTAALPLNAWTHLAATFDGATLTLYVNGTQAASLAAGGNIATSAGALRIGGNNIWPEWFSGQIDEVRIYNRALSPAEIQSDMNLGVG